MIGKGELCGGLYILHQATAPSEANSQVPFVSSVNSDNYLPIVKFSSKANKNYNAQLWHSRLGHLSDKILHLLNNKLHLNCSSFSTHKCDVSFSKI